MTEVFQIIDGTKEFHGVKAITNVNFSLLRGEIHSLLGENGAGKSTMTKVAAGVYQLSSGSFVFEGKETTFLNPSEALNNGVVMVFQENSLVPNMTVSQNIYLGAENFFNSLAKLNIKASRFLQSLNFNVDPNLLVSQLGAAQKQMVEIARAVHHNAKVIIFDEPTATLTPEEKHHFFGLMQRLKKEGVSIVFISHALEEALEHSDRITVLRDGELIETDKAKNFNRERIVKAMIGRDLTDSAYASEKTARKKPRKRGRKTLEVENLSMGSMVKNSTFSAYSGQITGVFGLVGSGRTEMMKVVSGVYKRNIFHGGNILLNGKYVRYLVPRTAVNDGIIYVTEDRKSEGFFENFGISQNIQLGKMVAEDKLWNTVSLSEAKTLADHWIERLNIKTKDINSPVVELSGGNQQKVVIAKGLVQKPKVVIFDEPTRGVDVGAIKEIHDFIKSLADEGITVIVVSSYLPEVMSISDRILVARLGQIVEEFEIEDASEEKIIYAAVH